MERDEVRSAYRRWDTKLQPAPGFAVEWLEWSLGFGEDPPPPSLWEDLEDERSAPKSSWSLTLLGDTGRGKTMTAAKVMRRYVEMGGRGGLWIVPDPAFDLVQRQKQENGYSEFQERIIKAKLLVFDEYGQGTRGLKQGDAQDSWLMQRQRQVSPTLVTTNARTFEDMPDQRIASRLRSGADRLMEGEDARYDHGGGRR
jgi:DNA replication protein DnaC